MKREACRGLILSRIKFGGGIEDIKDEPHSDPSFGIKWHYMAKPAKNDWFMKGTVRFVEK